MSKNAIIKGAFILTATGLLTRFIGFFFRIFLSHTFGEEQVGLYQLIFPIYALCFSLSSAGIETSLSRSVAHKISQGKKREADIILYQALFISLALSVLLCILLQKGASFFSIYVIGDLRCEPLLYTLSFALPFASLHSCICGYYLGQKKTKVPAISQFLEQIARVGSVFLICKFMSHHISPPTIRIAVIGLAIGEGISALFCLRYFTSRKHTTFSFSLIKKNGHTLRELLSLAIPLTSNRIFMNLLQSVETISIPIFLQKYGYSNADSLRTYGVLTGMALPCIFFPTAITNSVSTMLLPTVAEIQAENSLFRLKQLIQKVILFGFGLGAVCGIVFLVFGNLIGNILFNSPMVGNYLQTLAWLCPFMYMNSTLLSVINGLGRANHSLIINVCSLIIRISGAWFGILTFGMQGYLWGLLISQIFVSLLCIWNLKCYLSSRELQ